MGGEAAGEFGQWFHCVSCGVFGNEQNARCFDNQELSLIKLKFLLLKSLYEWCSMTSSIKGFLDFMD